MGVQLRTTSASVPGMLGFAARPRSTGEEAIDIEADAVDESPEVNPRTVRAFGIVVVVAARAALKPSR
ncbi:unannotated protein [freshwater metagenome]|uniref:Unannotated protein n=1 Tax=freshwater metagenome TaxID=449393 RepID=A0A6J5YFD9_9ZZZZ